MTVEKFKALIEQRYVIRCDDISERNLVLELLVLLGYRVNSASMEYLNPGNMDDKYLHPGMSSYENVICCRRRIDDVKNIGFSEVKNLIDYLDTSIDERSFDEFSKNFTALMC